MIYCLIVFHVTSNLTNNHVWTLNLVTKIQLVQWITCTCELDFDTCSDFSKFFHCDFKFNLCSTYYNTWWLYTPHYWTVLHCLWLWTWNTVSSCSILQSLYLWSAIFLYCDCIVDHYNIIYIITRTFIIWIIKTVKQHPGPAVYTLRTRARNGKQLWI